MLCSYIYNELISATVFSSPSPSGLQPSVQADRLYAFCRNRFQHVREVLQRRGPLIPRHRARQDRSDEQIPGGRGRGGRRTEHTHPGVGGGGGEGDESVAFLSFMEDIETYHRDVM